MKRIITLITLVLVSASTLMYAQSSSETRQAERKAQREAQKAREKAAVSYTHLTLPTNSLV